MARSFDFNPDPSVPVRILKLRLSQQRDRVAEFRSLLDDAEADRAALGRELSTPASGAMYDAADAYVTALYGLLGRAEQIERELEMLAAAE